MNLKSLSRYIWNTNSNFHTARVKISCLHQTFWVNEYWYMALKCQNWLTNTKLFFWESKANAETLQKLSPYISVSYKIVLKTVTSLNRILWPMKYWFKSLKCKTWLMNTKLLFWESAANIETLWKVCPYIWVSYKFVLKSGNLSVCQSPPSLQKRSPYIRVFYKFVLKSVKSWNRILWALEYWFKILKCQIPLTNTKPFFWESETNVETFQKLSPYIRVFYKFVLKTVKSWNRILWALEYWFKTSKCQIWLTNTKPFFWESEANVETLQKPSPYIWISYKFVLKSGEKLSLLWLLLFRMFWMLNIQLSNIQLEIMLQIQILEMWHIPAWTSNFMVTHQLY